MYFPFIIDNDFLEINNSAIFIYKNVFNNEEVELIKKNIDEYTPFSEEYLTSDEGNCNVRSNFTTFNLLSIQNPQIEKIVKRVFEMIQRKLLHKVNNISSIIGYEPMQFRKIYGATRLHVDGVSWNERDGGRLYSVIIALNSDYEGGEFVFPIQNIRVKLKAGEAIIFPPYWTHPHCTNDLNGTFRYTINTWLTSKNV
jgi:hypothetical protein